MREPSKAKSPSPESRRSPFLTTDWSAVRRAGDIAEPGNADALEALCRSYWQPLYVFVRRRGYSPEDACDLTQGLFADLLTREGFAKADPNRGRFRTFLLTSMANHLSKHAEHQSAQKRGGGELPISLDAHEGEDFFQLESGERFEPERLFDRRWAQQVSKLALDRLGNETDLEGVPGRFERLRRYLLAEPEPGAYETTASELGLSVNGVKTAVRRLRLRFGGILREEVARTVAEPGDVEDELGYLLSVLSAP